ncbi:ROK family protein [Xanthomonas vesicatoria]|uniref:ROK family protein n=2 Tax=Xanthomonas vesicatoria TaxID=56460 RepID=A0AAJ0IVB8_9XANT|nr:ROK family protein [Xanthomonas vesicatoria]APO95851.1 XylR family transcriptional regulator [Xanthomonas vesicatoria]APP75966.1 XylR family transcriptional regulator [Xanthomonas vesicatoria ATCC 35937]EGD07413.1 transcriptional regulator/sugar kinase [Xanthomonas vesicatoria ATCC 35937]KHM91042.1 XylR family transcriptional regulator [Xanthomonas vesicatoria]KHM96625.1 XylR family transcriptional regulator [Xanthomonas vesicatoria]
MSSFFAHAAIRSHYRRRSDGQAAGSSERALLDLIRSAGQLARADLPRASGLSVPGTKGIIDPLVAQGLLQLGPSLRRGRGQPSVQLSLVPGYAFSVGVSVMVDGIAVVLIDFAGQVRGMRQLTAFPLTLDLLAARLPELLEQLLQAAGVDRQQLFGVGISMTGPRIGDGTRVNPPLSLAAEWMQVELDLFIAERLQLPVWMDNDAHCAALAEALYGVGRQWPDLVYLTIADGFAAGVIAAGNVHRGAHGNVGELGRISAITGMARPTLESLRQALVADGHVLPDLHTMLQRYDPAWPQIEAWLDAVQPTVTLAVAAIIALIDPRVIVFGARLPEDLAQRLIARIAFESAPRRGVALPYPALLVGQVQAHATVLGAAMLPFKETLF